MKKTETKLDNITNFKERKYTMENDFFAFAVCKLQFSRLCY